MTKGITGWIRTHTPIGHSKSEQPGRRESRVNDKLEGANRKVTFSRHLVDINTVMARVAESKRRSTKPPEPAPLPSNSNEAAPTAETAVKAKAKRIPPKSSEPPPARPLSAAPKVTVNAEAVSALAELDPSLESASEAYQHVADSAVSELSQHPRERNMTVMTPISALELKMHQEYGDAEQLLHQHDLSKENGDIEWELLTGDHHPATNADAAYQEFERMINPNDLPKQERPRTGQKVSVQDVAQWFDQKPKPSGSGK
jgi:hypothetical protein